MLCLTNWLRLAIDQYLSAHRHQQRLRQNIHAQVVQFPPKGTFCGAGGCWLSGKAAVYRKARDQEAEDAAYEKGSQLYPQLLLLGI